MDQRNRKNIPISELKVDSLYYIYNTLSTGEKAITPIFKRYGGDETALAMRFEGKCGRLFAFRASPGGWTAHLSPNQLIGRRFVEAENE